MKNVWKKVRGRRIIYGRLAPSIGHHRMGANLKSLASNVARIPRLISRRALLRKQWSKPGFLKSRG